MSYRRAYIADANNTNQVVLDGVSQPYPFPAPTRRRRVELHDMRPGASSPGRRVPADMGSAESYQDLELVVRRITRANLELIRDKYLTYPPVAVLVSLADDYSEIKYTCVWAEDGLQVERTTYDPNLWRVTMRLHVVDADDEAS